MAGNVWEWTMSLWGDWPYPYAKYLKERENLAADNDVPRVRRGGAFLNYRGGPLRCAVRGRRGPPARGYRLGFRIVVAPVKN